MADECRMDWVTFEDKGTISIHRRDRRCSNLGKNDPARYARAVKNGGEWPYLFHASESAAERYAQQKYDPRKDQSILPAVPLRCFPGR